jgi:hypothetical protein
MSSYDLYGIACADLEAARAIIEKALGIEFVPHESLYLGEYYRFGMSGEENLLIQKNYDSDDDEWREDSHRDQLFLLYVNRTYRPEEFRQALEGVPEVSFLRHDEF